MRSQIISADDVLDALVCGFYVLMIDKSKFHKYGALCVPLNRERFSDIEKYIEENDPNYIFVKTEKYVEDNNEEEI